MNCQDNSRLKVPLPEACRTADIGCVPISNGKPKCPPEPDQLPLAYDPNSKTIWIFDCDSRAWNAYTRFSLSELGEVSLDNFRDVCNMLKVPVFYNPGTGTVEGHMTLADFGEKLKECMDIPGSDSKTVVKAGDNVNVTSSIVGSTTTYTVSATGGGNEDSKTVIEAGDNISLTSNKSGATTTYRISSTVVVPETKETVLEGGTNINVTRNESGSTVTYKIDSTAEGADGNDITVVEAGSNVNVTSSTSGNTTTYTVSATGGGPQDSKTILQGKDGGNVTVTSTTSGATTTYTLDSKDSRSVVKAGSGISVTSATSGDTTTYTVTNTGEGGGGGTPLSITGGTGIEVDKTSSGGVDNYTIKSTVPTVTVTAGDNVTVDKTTSTDGSTVDYKVSSTGGGPQDSKTIVAAGTGISVTSTTSGATTTYTVTNTEGGGGTGSDGEVAEVFKGVGGAACVDLATNDLYVIYQARDNTLLYGTASGTIGGSASIGTYIITNPFNVPSLLQLDIDYQLTAAAMPTRTDGSVGDLEGGSIASIVHLGENRNVDYVGLVQSGPIVSTDECIAVINLTEDDRVSWLWRNPETNQIENYASWMARSNLLRYTTVLSANETKTIYLNHWESLYAGLRGGRFLWHVKAIANATVFKNVRTN